MPKVNKELALKLMEEGDDEAELTSRKKKGKVTKHRIQKNALSCRLELTLSSQQCFFNGFKLSCHKFLLILCILIFLAPLCFMKCDSVETLPSF